MTKILTSLFFALICCTATICNATERSTITETIAYDSQDEAAKAALTEIFTTNSETSNEFAGVIVQMNGKYFYTCPVSSGETSSFSVRAAIPHNGKIVAIFHNHPGHEYSQLEYFSPNDVQVAKEMNLTSYIGVNASHNIHKFVPGKSVVSAFYNGGASAIPDGFISSGSVI
jgi:hypothetical protein